MRADDAENIGYLTFSSPPAKVLVHWHNAPELLTPDAKPKILPFEGEALQTSFIDGALGNNLVTAFTTVGANTWTAPTGVTEIEVLVVGGGGTGGGADRPASGGGGAGGILHATSYPVTAGTTYNMTVGVGGVGAGDNSRDTGDNSVFDTGDETGTLTALGGGGGGMGNSGCSGGSTGGLGVDGGSCCGNKKDCTTGPGEGIQTAPSISGATITAYGNDGGVGVSPPDNGGGGAGGGHRLVEAAGARAC